MTCTVCLHCKAEIVEGGTGRLDQSGTSYLPARVYECKGCPKEARITLATGDRWQPYTERK